MKKIMPFLLVLVLGLCMALLFFQLTAMRNFKETNGHLKKELANCAADTEGIKNIMNAAKIENKKMMSDMQSLSMIVTSLKDSIERQEKKQTNYEKAESTVSNSKTRKVNNRIPGYIIEESGIDLLFPGQYHGEELADGIEQKDWWGVFKVENGYKIDKVEIEIKRVYDAVLDDDESNPTGKKVSIKGITYEEQIKGKMPDFMVSGIKELNSLTSPIMKNDYRMHVGVTSVVFPTKLFPGQTLVIKTDSIFCQLGCYGNADREEAAIQNYQLEYYTHYKITDKSTNKTKTIRKNQTLADFARLDEGSLYIQWIGDLNGDDLPDFLIDVSDHYNKMAPTLFLSTDSIKKENKEKDDKNDGKDVIIKPVANLISVGC